MPITEAGSNNICFHATNAVGGKCIKYYVKYNNNTLRTDVHIEYFAPIFSVSLKNEPEPK